MDPDKATTLALVFAALVLVIPAAGEVNERSSPEAKIHGTVLDEVASLENAGKLRIVVILKETTDRVEGSHVTSKDVGSSRTVARSTDVGRFGDLRNSYSTIPAFSIETTPEGLLELASQDYVEKIVPVREVRAFLGESIPVVKADDVWKTAVAGTNITGQGIGVCIVDTGVDYTHPDFGDRVVKGPDFVNSDNDPMDDNGHGTHVAGIAGANGGIVGVAPNITIVAVKVLNSNGLGFTDDVVAGIDWCVNNAADHSIKVISLSLGGGEYDDYCDDDPSEQPFRDSINAAVQEKIAVVAATGNDGSTAQIASPACIRNATSVAATYDANVGSRTWGDPVICSDASTVQDKIVCFSNRNSITDLLAPGAIINSTKFTGGYDQKAGTSMATPHVAGVFALIYQKYDAMFGSSPTPEFVLNLTNSTGVTVTDSGGTGRNFTRVDALAAISDISDGQGPRWGNSSGQSTIEIGVPTNLSVFWTDNVLLHTAMLSTNETGQFRNYTDRYSSPVTFSSPTGWSNFSWSNTSLSNGTKVTWKVHANDTSGNQNATSEFSFLVVDTTGPSLFDFTDDSGSTYVLGKTYGFNVTVSDYSGVGTVMLNFSGRGNVTAIVLDEINSTAAKFHANVTDIPGGSHSYMWYANDTLSNFGSSEIMVTEVLPASTSISILFNGTQSNSTYDRGDVANITATSDASEPLDISIFADFTGAQAELNTSSGSVASIVDTTGIGIGVFNVTAAYNGTSSNYSSSSATLFMALRETFRNSSVSINASNVTRVESGNTNVTIDFLLNGSVVNNETSVTVSVDNPIGSRPAGLSMRFIKLNVSDAIKEKITYYVLNYSYQPSELPSGVDEDTVRISRWDGSDWRRLDGGLLGGVSTSEKYVWSNLTEFSDFAISGLLSNGESCSLNSDCASDICSAGVCVASLPSTSSSGGGGGGGAAGAPVSSSNRETRLFNIEQAGIFPVSMDRYADHGILGVLINAISPASNVRVSVEKLAGRPVAVARDAPGIVYAYVEITKSGIADSEVAGATVRFLVNRSWIVGNDISSVYLNRYSAGEWERMAATSVDFDETTVTFEADTPGFSTFAITGEAEIPEDMTETMLEETQVGDVTEDHPDEVEQSNYATIVTVVGIVSAGAAAYIFLRRLRKNRQTQTDAKTASN